MSVIQSICHMITRVLVGVGVPQEVTPQPCTNAQLSSVIQSDVRALSLLLSVLLVSASLDDCYEETECRPHLLCQMSIKTL